MWVESIIRFTLSNFSFVIFDLAVVAIFIHRYHDKRMPMDEIIFRWMSLFALGFTGIYAFILHAFFPVISAQTIQWLPSPFQFEVAMADLALGVLGICAYNASSGFRLATVVAAAICLWGDALGHIYQMIHMQNFALGNAGTWFWTDVFVPFFLILSYLQLKKSKK